MTVTWNPLDAGSNIVLSNGDLSAETDTSSVFHTVRATLGRSSGKYYFEVTHHDAGGSYNVTMGVQRAAEALEGYYVGDTYDGWGYQSNGRWYNSAMNGSAHPAWQATGDTLVMCAVDLDNGHVWFGKGGVWEGDPGAGTGAAFTNLSGTLYPAVTPYIADGSTLTGHFTTDDQTYSPPTGFAAWDPGGSTVALEDIRLDLAAYYEGRADLATLLEAAYYLGLVDLPLRLNVLGQAYADLPAHLQAASIGRDDLALHLDALAGHRQDIAMFLQAVSPLMLQDLALYLSATDGTTRRDLSLRLTAIQKAPAFRAVIAQRLTSIKRGAV